MSAKMKAGKALGVLTVAGGLAVAGASPAAASSYQDGRCDSAQEGVAWSMLAAGGTSALAGMAGGPAVAAAAGVAGAMGAAFTASPQAIAECR
ncbi:hypothetical protein GCM10025790_27760 [Nesterenkonia rhizosphaerae]|uniref:Bacteriocin n=2 Tax=Nesterenkonia rhizosphaerae TaxID=1348272 RepID=A0ABP9G5U3_9MICC